MIEYATHVKAHDAVASAAVNSRKRVAVWRPNCQNTVAGIAAKICDYGSGVVGIGTQETGISMAISTFGAGNRMWWAGCLADSYGAVVTTGA